MTLGRYTFPLWGKKKNISGSEASTKLERSTKILCWERQKLCIQTRKFNLQCLTNRSHSEEEKDKTEKNREVHSVSATELIKPFKLSLGRNSKDLWTCFYTAPRYYKASSIIICPQLSLDKYYLLIGASVRNSIRGRDN